MIATVVPVAALPCAALLIVFSVYCFVSSWRSVPMNKDTGQ